MKKLSRLVLTFAMSLLLVLGLCPNTVYAEESKGETHATSFKNVVTGNETATVTVTGMKPGDEIKAYKVVDVTYDPVTNTVDHQWNSQFESIAKAKYATVEDYSKAGDAGAKELYLKIIESYSQKTEVASQKATGDSVTLTLPLGQYILVGIGENVYTPMTATLEPVQNPNEKSQYILYDVNVEAKATTPSIEKKIKKGDKWVDERSTKINEDRDFKITVTAPIYPANAQEKYFNVIDTMEDGLKGAKNLKITNALNTVLVKGVDYKITYKKGENVVDPAEADNFVIEFNMDSDNVLGQTLNITYSSLATANLTPGTSKNNTVKLEWPKNLWNSEAGKNEKEDKVKVYTYGLQIQKLDEKNNKLSGAEFKLYTDAACQQELSFEKVNNEYVKVVNGSNTDNLKCDDNGYLQVKGLDEGTYYLKEMRAPTGYVLLKDPVEVTVTQVNNGKYFAYEVKNQKGFNLPKTGDTMTMIFTTFGIFVMSGALASALYLRRKH